MIKYLLFAGVSAAVLAGFAAEGDEVAIPAHFLAFEGKACKRQAAELAGATIAESYCNCVTEGIAARYSFKGYVLRNAAMSWEAWREGVPVESIAGRDPVLRDLHHGCRNQVLSRTDG